MTKAKRYKCNTKYVMTLNAGTPTCFPKDLDTTNFKEVTTVDDYWAKFLDAKTGKIHDCLDYYNESIKEVFEK